jgi:hypothetical protein
LILEALSLRLMRRGEARWAPLHGEWTLHGLGGPARSLRSTGGAERIAVLAGAVAAAGLRATFKVLEPSPLPPAGGAIIYTDLRSSSRFLSFHFCPGKGAIECFEREGSRWRRLGAPVPFPVLVGQAHHASLTMEGDLRRVVLDGREVLSVRADRPGGRIAIGAKLCPVEFSSLSIIPSSGAARGASGSFQP